MDKKVIVSIIIVAVLVLILTQLSLAPIIRGIIHLVIAAVLLANAYFQVGKSIILLIILAALSGLFIRAAISIFSVV